MQRIFITPEQLNTQPILIQDEDYNHIRNVLRMRQGEKLLLCDSTDKEYLCEITAFDDTKRTVSVKIEDIFGNTRELPAEITLFQGYPKGDKIETIVQKAVELGVARIVPVMMKRSVVKLDDKKAAKKVERLNNIALNAAKQSKRGRIPEVSSVMNIKEAVECAKKMEVVLLPYENAEGMERSRDVLRQACETHSIGVFIGPEGGFEAEEVAMIEEIGGEIITLGHRILRTETAGITVLSLLMFELEKD